ncbi:hypothetical protein [Lacrimispora sp.]|uniref:hypothetical protein n=1 Tax=Lacrimispora sp. TaxID=2719234 RepID=UPI0028AB3157|nr:hypothetical protein [Lacrimispora sp.]
MEAYLTANDLKSGGEFEGVVLEEDMEQLSDKALENLLKSGKDLIDAYCGTSFDDKIPNMVKVVNAQLVPALIRDDTKNSESVDGYSYQNNLSAFSAILSKLDFLMIGGKTISERKRSVRARVI